MNYGHYSDNGERNYPEDGWSFLNPANENEKFAYDRWAEDRRDDALDDSPEAYQEWLIDATMTGFVA